MNNCKTKKNLAVLLGALILIAFPVTNFGMNTCQSSPVQQEIENDCTPSPIQFDETTNYTEYKAPRFLLENLMEDLLSYILQKGQLSELQFLEIISRKNQGKLLDALQIGIVVALQNTTLNEKKHSQLINELLNHFKEYHNQFVYIIHTLGLSKRNQALYHNLVVQSIGYFSMLRDVLCKQLLEQKYIKFIAARPLHLQEVYDAFLEKVAKEK